LAQLYSPTVEKYPTIQQHAWLLEVIPGPTHLADPGDVVPKTVAGFVLLKIMV